MSWIIGAIIATLVTAVAFYIISKLPIGVEVDDFGKAVISALVFGFLNAIAMPLKAMLNLGPLEYIFFPILFLLNILIFGITAKLVEGFRLQSIWSAVIGAFALTVINQLLIKILPII